jgi:hypothetical protein
MCGDTRQLRFSFGNGTKQAYVHQQQRQFTFFWSCSGRWEGQIHSISISAT